MDDQQSPSSDRPELLDAWLTGLRFGEPISHKALALIPLYADGVKGRLQYRPLALAIASGEVLVTEAPGATVPTLRLTNRGQLPVLILDGEELVGGRQNRVVDTRVLPCISLRDTLVAGQAMGRGGHI